MAGSERQKGYAKGYYTGRKTRGKKAKGDQPLGADKQKKALDKALKTLRNP